MLAFITIVGLLLRLIFINKPEGLWNDEYVSWYVAGCSDGFWQEVWKQCHMPLYYLYLKPFTGCSDIILRLTSAIPGVLAIPAMYYAGREFSKKTGLILASITSVLQFLIYYSQEVRFYSLLFLFSSLSLLFTIRVLKRSSKLNTAGWILSNLLILLTHILGVIYVFFNSVYVVYKKKTLHKSVIIACIFVCMLIIPFGSNVLKMLPSSQWWGHFSYTNILFLFSDYFSPVLSNNVNAPPVFFYSRELVFWMTAPVIIAITALIAGAKRIKGLLTVSALFVITLAILAIGGKLVFITKYSIEILPVLILCRGLCFERLKKTGIILFFAFIIIHLGFFFTPHYRVQTIRSEGHRIPAEILKARKPDKTVFTYYEPNRFSRYIDLKNSTYISKINRFEYREQPASILNNVKIGETVSVVFLDSVSFFNEDIVEKNWDNPMIPEMFLTFSHIKNALIKEMNSNYKDFHVDKLGSWTVITGTRYK